MVRYCMRESNACIKKEVKNIYLFFLNMDNDRYCDHFKKKE